MTVTRHPLQNLFATAALASALMFAWTAPAHAQQRRSILERYQTFQDFQQRQFGFASNGYRVIDLETCREPDHSAAWWVAVYDHQPIHQGTGGFDLFIEAGGWQSLTTEVNQLASQGWFLDDLNPASDASAWTHHVGVLNEVQGSTQQLIHETSFAAFHANWLAHQGAGLRLVDVDVANISGQAHFYGVMRPGAQQERLIHEASWASFNTVRTAMESNGWRLRDIAVQQGEYIGVLNTGGGPTIVDLFSDWPSILDRWAGIDGNRRTNQRLKDVECWVEGGQLRYAGLWRGAGRVRRPEGGPPRDTVADPNAARAPAPPQPPLDRDPG